MNRDPRSAARGSGAAQLASDDYPQLAALLARPSAEFRAELDRLSATARGLTGRPAAQQALQAAAHVLGELYKHKD